MRYAEVAVNSTFPSRQTFSYSVPDGIDARPGHAAYVPFGRRTLQGIVVEVHDEPVFSEPEKIRPIRSLIGDAPLLDDDRVELAKWIADYYVAPIFDAVALLLPPGFERRPLTLIQPLVDRSEIAGLDLPPRQAELLEALFAAPSRELETLRAHLKQLHIEGVGREPRAAQPRRARVRARPPYHRPEERRGRESSPAGRRGAHAHRRRGAAEGVAARRRAAPSS